MVGDPSTVGPAPLRLLQAQQRFDQIRTTLPAAVAPDGSLASVAFGEPRVLWLLTV